jgi:hypothetical protein
MNQRKDPGVAAMRERFSSFLREHPEEQLSAYLARGIQYPPKPLSENGRLRVNPLLLILTAITLFAVGVFLFFSVAQP